jgi:hypothetical protein
MIADRIVPTFEMISALLAAGMLPFHSASAVSIPLATVPRQHEPDGFMTSQEQPGLFIFRRMSCNASDWPFIRSSSLMLAMEWPKQ